MLLILSSCSNEIDNNDIVISIQQKNPIANYGHNIVFNSNKYYIKLSTGIYTKDSDSNNLVKLKYNVPPAPFSVKDDMLFNAEEVEFGKFLRKYKVISYNLLNGKRNSLFTFSAQRNPPDINILQSSEGMFVFAAGVKTFSKNTTIAPSLNEMTLIANMVTDNLAIYKKDSVLFLYRSGECESIFDTIRGISTNYGYANVLSYHPATQSGYLFYQNALYKINNSKIILVANPGKQLATNLISYSIRNNNLLIATSNSFDDANGNSENIDTCYNVNTNDDKVNVIYQTKSYGERLLDVTPEFLCLYNSGRLAKLSVTTKQVTDKVQLFDANKLEGQDNNLNFEVGGNCLYFWSGHIEKIVDLNRMKLLAIPNK